MSEQSQRFLDKWDAMPSYAGSASPYIEHPIQMCNEAVNIIRDLQTENAYLEAQLAAHLENEGDECPLCACEAQVEAERKEKYAWMALVDHARNDLLNENDRMTWAAWFVEKIDALLEPSDER